MQCSDVYLTCADSADTFAQAGKILSFENRFGGMFVRFQLFGGGVGEKVHVKPVVSVHVLFSIVLVVVVSGGGGCVVCAAVGVRSRLVLNALLS